MMNLYVYDIEVYPNLFMVTIKSLSTGKIQIWRIGLGQNDLLNVVQFFRSDNRVIIGFNSLHYDNQIIHMLLKQYWRLGKMSEESVTTAIYRQSMKIITENDSQYKYDKFFHSIDLLNIIRIGMITKSLKLVAVNLKWKKIQDLPLPPSHHVQPNEIDLLEKYNVNDVEITEALYHHLDKTGQLEAGAIEMRVLVGRTYGISVLSESDSGMGLKIFEGVYARESQTDMRKTRRLTSDQRSVLLGDVISHKIRFQTPEMQAFLVKLSKEVLTVEKPLSHLLKIGNTTYKLAKGGLHSEHPKARVYTKPEGGFLRDADVASYYPRIVTELKVAPRHLDVDAFIRTMDIIISDRLKAKAEKDAVKAYAMKIGANSCFGRFGFEKHWLFDLHALYGVTLNGQLALLMLIEKLEESGIEVVYANTDGITSMIEGDFVETYDAICTAWQHHFNFELEFDEFEKFFIRDVNNYLVIKPKGKTKAKGDYAPDQHKNPMKGFDAPVVAHAVFEYLVHGRSIKETIRGTPDVLDFCMAQKVGPSYDAVVYSRFDRETGRHVRSIEQKVNRYVVATEGGKLYKVKAHQMPEEMLSSFSGTSAGLVILVNDLDKVERDYPNGVPIDYPYYEERASKLALTFYLPEGKARRKGGRSTHSPGQQALFK